MTNLILFILKKKKKKKKCILLKELIFLTDSDDHTANRQNGEAEVYISLSFN